MEGDWWIMLMGVVVRWGGRGGGEGGREGGGEEGGNNVITSAAAPAPPRFLWCL